MNAADYLILAVLGISMLAALLRGLVSEVMSLAVWVLALWISATTSGTFAATFLTGIEQSAVRLGAAYIAIFLLVLVLGGMLTWLVRRIIAKTGLSGTDRLLGALFGFARGLLIVFSVVLFAGFTAIPKQPLWQESLLLPAVQSTARGLSQYLPASVHSFLSFPIGTESAAVPESAEANEPATRSNTSPELTNPPKPAATRPKNSTSKAN
jgi:membrane protein required for colicin V production